MLWLNLKVLNLCSYVLRSFFNTILKHVNFSGQFDEAAERFQDNFEGVGRQFAGQVVCGQRRLPQRHRAR